MVLDSVHRTMKTQRRFDTSASTSCKNFFNRGVIFSAIIFSLNAQASKVQNFGTYKLTHAGSTKPAKGDIKTSYGIALMGGGPSTNAAFRWMTDKAGGGDAVVIRANDGDDYTDYIYKEIGGVNSVTMISLMDHRASSVPAVLDLVRRAHMIYFAGGDQFNYHNLIRDTPLHDLLLERIRQRSIPIGGKSAGLAILGQYYFSAAHDSISSSEAVQDPSGPNVTIERGFLNFPELKNVITDTHFSNRHRMGRLISFIARIMYDQHVSVTGLGVDEKTNLVIDQKSSRVIGEGAVYEVTSTEPPQRLIRGEPLDFRNLKVKVRYEQKEPENFIYQVVDGKIIFSRVESPRVSTF